MNETHKQSMIREALGIDAGQLAAMTFVLAILAGAGFATSQSTKDVPVVNSAPATTSESTMVQLATLAAMTSDADRSGE